VLDALGNYYAADFSNFAMLTDVDRLRQIVQAWRTAFPDLHYTVEALLAEDDQVAGHFTLSGTQHGPLRLWAWPMLPVTGKHFTVKQMHLFRRVMGCSWNTGPCETIWECWSNWDM
jgi:predicted ester cyclase